MKKFLFVLLSIVITLAFSVFQRMTGPTHTKTLKVEISGAEYQLKLPRSGVQNDKPVEFANLPENTTATLSWKRYPTEDPYTETEMVWHNDTLKGFLPAQPAAGKLQYFVTINGKDYFRDEPLIIRFRNDVPAPVMIGHILLMFLAMFWACYTALLALANDSGYKRHLWITTVLFFVGGFIFGPLMQHYAFGVYWSGFPVGSDLTDTKTLVSLLFFVAALCTLRWRHNRIVTIVATVVMLVIFTIPHSMRGSEYNYQTGQVTESR